MYGPLVPKGFNMLLGACDLLKALDTELSLINASLFPKF